LPANAKWAIALIMWLNQQTLDAIRIMAELAATWPVLVRTSEVAASSGITMMNVQKTVYALGQADLLETVRGRQGGVRLSRAADRISIGEIVRAFEPKDCPANFLPRAEADAALARLMFKAHRGFFQPLETALLSEFDIRGPQVKSGLSGGAVVDILPPQPAV
jgi:Rrf2 family transcriptional regulator, nitric oxide-sensitive transcriptional repressor